MDGATIHPMERELGYIYLHRQVLSSDLWAIKPEDTKIALTCFLKASWCDRMVNGIEIRRGQWLTHLKEIAELSGPKITVKRVRGALGRLTQSGILGTGTVTRLGLRYLMVTVMNYDYWNDLLQFQKVPGTGSGTGSGTTRARGGHEVGTTITEVIKGSEDIKGRIPYVAFMQAWNAYPSLPTIKVMTTERKKKLNKRATKADFRHYWPEALEALAYSDWHTGGNDRGWCADVDWFLKNDTNWTKAWERQITRRVRSEDAKKKYERQAQESIKRGEEELAQYDTSQMPAFLKKKLEELADGKSIPGTPEPVDASDS